MQNSKSLVWKEGLPTVQSKNRVKPHLVLVGHEPEEFTPVVESLPTGVLVNFGTFAVMLGDRDACALGVGMIEAASLAEGDVSRMN
jgi:hypothetical protein